MNSWLDKIRTPNRDIKLSLQVSYSILILLFGVALGVLSKWLDNMWINDAIWWQHILGIDITSFCKSISGYSIGTKRNPGGTCYDLSGLYLKVLEDLWEVDAGLNGDIKYISIDLSKAPGELTEGEKSAISYIFAKAHDKQCLQLTFEELREQGYIKKDELYWENGLLFSITDSMKAEEQYHGLRVIKFDAQKWRSGTGAYIFSDCTASWPQMGTWTDYNVGAHAIS